MPRRKLITKKTRQQQDLLQLTKGKVWSIIDLMYKKDQCPLPLRQKIQANKLTSLTMTNNGRGKTDNKNLLSKKLPSLTMTNNGREITARYFFICHI